MAEGGNILTRKIGPLPGWAWGAAAAGLGVVYFYMAGRSQQQTAASTGGQPALSPAAGATIPFVPSVTIAGLSTNTGPGSSAPPPAAAGTPDTPCDPSQWRRDGSAFRYTGPGAYVKGGQAFFAIGDWSAAQAILAGGGTLWFFPAACAPAQFTGVPAGWGGGTLYTTAPVGGGGGYGLVNVTPMMGWTTGWAPLAGGGRGDGSDGGAGGAAPGARRSNRPRATRRAGRPRPLFPRR